MEAGVPKASAPRHWFSDFHRQWITLNHFVADTDEKAAKSPLNV